MDLMQQISMLYAQAQDRRDVEDVELDHHDPDIRQTPLLGPGLQTHEPYFALAVAASRHSPRSALAARYANRADVCRVRREAATKPPPRIPAKPERRFGKGAFRHPPALGLHHPEAPADASRPGGSLYHGPPGDGLRCLGPEALRLARP